MYFDRKVFFSWSFMSFGSQLNALLFSTLTYKPKSLNACSFSSYSVRSMLLGIVKKVVGAICSDSLSFNTLFESTFFPL
jgi:hypothetical protein